MTEHVEHVVEGDAAEASHEVASTVAETVGSAVSQAHSEGLAAMRAIIDRQEERIHSLESRLEDSAARDQQRTHAESERTAELIETVIVAHAIEEAAHAAHEGEHEVAPEMAEPVTEVEAEPVDETPVVEEESKPRPKRRGLYGKRG